METELYSGAAIATRYGVSQSAVSNWIKREILPDECKPVKVNSGGARHSQMWLGSQLPALDKWYERHAEKGTRQKMPVPSEQREEIDNIKSCLPVTEFWSDNGGCLLMNLDDQTYIIRVWPDGSSGTAYLSTEPIETLVSVVEDTYTSENLPELQGFGSGWEC